MNTRLNMPASFPGAAKHLAHVLGKLVEKCRPGYCVSKTVRAQITECHAVALATVFAIDTQPDSAPHPVEPVARVSKGPVAFFVKFADWAKGDRLTGHIDLFTADQLAAVRRAALEEAAQAAQPDDSYQDEWFEAKADAVKRIRALMA